MTVTEPQFRSSDHTAGAQESFYPGGFVLQCPRCGGPVPKLQCPQCLFAMDVRRGIVHALPPEREEHYAPFIAGYERIRAAEGRGSKKDAYYLGLPFKDATGNNTRQWEIRARSYRYLLKRLLQNMSGGAVLDVGAGNCWLSFRLSRLGYNVAAVDLLTNDDDGLGAAEHFSPHLAQAIPRFRAEATRLPFAGAQFDVILFNASFHYSEDYEATLQEALRCLKPGGRVIISDTPWYSMQESGQQMVAERRALFQRRYGTASDAMQALEFVTDARLQGLADKVSISWTVHRPWYGWRWAMRPLVAKLRGQREPSRFRIYVAKKHATEG